VYIQAFGIVVGKLELLIYYGVGNVQMDLKEMLRNRG
jgi:hypothetical protein